VGEQDEAPKTPAEEELLQQQFLRALSSFEGIVLSQIDIKNKLGDRLNYSIRTGVIILSVIALSILVLLLTLSSQIDRISSVVAAMNIHFQEISSKMDRVRDNMVTMEQRISLLEQMDQHTRNMSAEIAMITGDMESLQGLMGTVGGHLQTVRGRVGNIAVSIDRMNAEVHGMSLEVHRMGQPARSLNKLLPFP
jgi:methyl-accepting chemotaxis protein